MPPYSETVIEVEARRLWEASGRPIWSHPLDHWSEAIGSLSRRSGDSPDQNARTTFGSPGQTRERLKRKELRPDA